MEPGKRVPMIVFMRGVFALLPKAGVLVIVFGGTVGAVDSIRCHDSFFPVVIDEKIDARADAYTEIVGETKSAVEHLNTDDAVIRHLAQSWVEGSKSGRLQQIYPGYCGESLIEGPKGDIFNSCASLANRLSELAEHEVEKGNPQANEDAIRALELINIVRFGNFETLFTAGSYLRRPFKVLNRGIGKLSESQKVRLAAVENTQTRDDKTEELSEVARRLKAQYASRYGEEMAKVDDNNYAFFLTSNPKHIAANRFFGFDRKVAPSVLNGG
ncbi:MAG: hypothetical protein JST12_03480 [Armatimonadetes bacterium]|nr:hypothetical protein [Armatimonadota bacterium]